MNYDFAGVERMLRRGTRLGFDWLTDAVGNVGVSRRERLALELKELNDALDADDKAAIADEVGDVIIVLASLAIVHGIDPSEAVMKAVMKVSNRLTFVVHRLGDGPHDLATLREVWNEAKQLERMPP